MRPTLYQLSYHIFLPLMAKKLKLNQLELLQKYFKMPSPNEIDNCALGVPECNVPHFKGLISANSNFKSSKA